PTGGCSPGRRQHPCGSVGKGDAQRSRGTKRHIVCDASTDQADRSSRRGGPLDRLDEAFVHASTGHAPKGKDKAVLLAALMAMGTNIGLTKMSEAEPGITYRQMANTVQW